MRHDYPLPMPPSHSPRPLIVRLRNWVGDVTLGLPMLQRLADEGYELTLLGKRWARELLAGQGWPVHVLPATTLERVRLLRRLRAEATLRDPGLGRRINALCLPDSLSSALEFRLAGWRALGHAWEGRAPLLGRAVARQRGVHELKVYWALGDSLLGHSAPLPDRVVLRPTAAQVDAARALRAANGIEGGCVFICPFAGGTWLKQDKTWPAFAEFVARELPRLGRTVVVCPAPGAEEALAREHFGSARILCGVDLGVFAALLQDAAVMVSNDTGPGHLAAAVGTPLVSVMGPSDPALWRPWGPRVQVLGGHGSWPDVSEVMLATQRALAGG